MKTMKKINLFFFGAGSIINEHIKAFRSQKNVCLYAILSRTPKKAIVLKKKYKIKHVFKKISEIHHEKNTISVAIVGVSVGSTYQVCKNVFNLFDFCLVEKPAGYNYEESKKIYSLPKKKNLKVFVALNRRFYSSSLSLHNLLHKAKGTRVVNILDYENTFSIKSAHPKKIIDNWMFSNSIHMIDYANFICRGRLISIKKNIFSKQKKLIHLIYSSGDICIYQSIWERPGPWTVTVSTNKFYFKLDPLEELSFRTTNSYKYNLIPRDNHDKTYKPGFYKQAGDFIKAIRGKPHNLVSLNKSLETMKLISILYNKK